MSSNVSLTITDYGGELQKERIGGSSCHYFRESFMIREPLIKDIKHNLPEYTSEYYTINKPKVRYVDKITFENETNLLLFKLKYNI